MIRIEPNTKDQPESYASGILYGSDLHISGQVGVDKTSGKTAAGIAAQAQVALGNLVAVVEAAGGGVQDVVKLTIYVADMEAFQKEAGAFTQAFAAVFSSGHIPAMTLVGVTALVSPEYLVEIEGIAKVAAK